MGYISSISTVSNTLTLFISSRRALSIISSKEGNGEGIRSLRSRRVEKCDDAP